MYEKGWALRHGVVYVRFSLRPRECVRSPEACQSQQKTSFDSMLHQHLHLNTVRAL